MKVKRFAAYIHPILLLVVHLLLCGAVRAQAVPQKEVVDSLHTRLQKSRTEAERIDVLKKLVNHHWQLPEEVVYLKQIIDVAGRADSIGTVYQGIAGLCRYYFNNNDLDSSVYWRNVLDSISRARGESPDALYRASNIICRKYLAEANYELAMNEALIQLSRAEKEQNLYGIMSSKQNLGLIYQAVRRDNEAVSAFREGLVLGDKNADKPGLLMTYLSDMIISTLRLHNFAETEVLLQKYLKLYDAEVLKFEAVKQTYPFAWHRWYIYSFYAQLHTQKGELEKAGEALANADSFIATETDESIKFPYYQAQALYFEQTKRYDQAIEAIDKALAIDRDLSLMKKQVDLLRAAGQNNKALLLYERLLELNANVSNEAFNRQIVQLRALNDLKDKDKQDIELLYQNEQIVVQQQILLISVVFSVALLLLLYSLFLHFRRTIRLKDELISEKESLVASEKLLQIAKEEAEQANRKKTAFIANISHEVRTPLNSIVGFSEILAEESSFDTLTEADRMLFADSINQNSEILLNLVNDVLDLSRLESVNFRFTFTRCDVVACCQEILQEVEPRVEQGVKLTFTPPVASLPITTDRFRFHQVICKLLINAAKFTSRGEINLSFDIRPGEVCFVVRDTGCGVPVEKQEQIFGRFEKLDDFAQGTGLGLPICKLIAGKLGGSLTIDPAYTGGSRFLFIHPLIDPEDALD